jgi:hypothetical protein
MFGNPKPDPMTELVEALKAEINYLRQALAEKDRQIVALTNASAYRLLHSNAPEPPAPPAPNPSEPYRPALTFGEVKENFES